LTSNGFVLCQLLRRQCAKGLEIASKGLLVCGFKTSGMLPGLSLDGVTGRLTLERGHWIAREPNPAQLWKGQLLIGTDRK
jgi:hypothetical protein